MVHHYEEETDVKVEQSTPETAPKFNATIVPPFQPPKVESVEAEVQCGDCDACPMAPASSADSVLPMVIVALGVAYAVGVATGALLFPVSAE